MGVANKIAGMAAPIILGATLLKGADGLEKKVAETTDPILKAELLNDMVARIQTPYIYLAVALFLVAVLFYFIQLPEVEEESSLEDADKVKRGVLSHPNLVLGVLALILYVAAEVIAGDGIIQYGRNIGISLDEAKNFTAYTLGAMLVGYLIGIVAIPKYIKQEDALKYSALSGIVFSLVAIFSSGYISVYAIALMGLSNALMWPAIFPLSIKGLGKATKLGSALLIMGIGPGGGIIPLLYAELGGPANPQRGFWIMVLCYIFILYFATYGHKKKSW